MNQRLELNRNETFHRRDWMAQRIGWAVWAAVLGAALAGFAGPGPMSHRRISAPDNSLLISYDRFARYQARSTLELILRPKQATDTLPVHFNQGFIDAVEVHRIEPAPAASFLGKEGLVYSFKVEEGAQEAHVTIHLEHQKLGSVRGTARLEGGDEATFHQFVYP